MALAPDEYAGFTMALLRMLAFAPLEGKMPKSLPAAVTHKEEAPALPKTEPAKTELPAQQKAQSVDTQPKAPEAPGGFCKTGFIHTGAGRHSLGSQYCDRQTRLRSSRFGVRSSQLKEESGRKVKTGSSGSGGKRSQPSAEGAGS